MLLVCLLLPLGLGGVTGAVPAATAEGHFYTSARDSCPGARMIKTIVVGYDDSASSRRALERAATLAKAFESRLIVTSATPVTASPGRSLGADPVEDAATELVRLAAARAYLEKRG